ncbi:MAG: single-stranded DNA-binding protein [Deltaproteobacteria bacterium]|nr:single-stranded DNA-binding protein [Deltaproteobacteria bacterium]
MASFNKVFVMGNLGADPDFAVTQGGQPRARLRVATSESWNDKASGQRQERTEWHTIIVWGRQAEHCQQYLRKGRTVLVEGRLQTRQWEDKEGQKRFTTEIVAINVQFVGGGAGGRAGGDEAPVVEPQGRDADPGAPAISDDDVPF